MNGGLAGGTFLNTYSSRCPNWVYPQLAANGYVKVDAYGKLVPWDGTNPPIANYFQTQKLLVQPVNSDAQSFAVKDNTGSSFFTVSTLPTSPLITSYVRHLFNGLASFAAGFTVFYGNAQFNTSIWAGVTSGTAAINTVDINATSSVTAAAFNTPSSATTSTLNNPTVFNSSVNYYSGFTTNGSITSVFNTAARFYSGILADTSYAEILKGYFGGTSTATSALNTTTLTVDSLATVNGTLNVVGTTGLSSLTTSAAATLYSLSVTNNATVSGTLGVTGNTTLGGNLIVTGSATLGSVTISTLSITNLSIPGTLIVSTQGNFGGASSTAQLNTGTFYASGLSNLAAVQATSLSTSGLATLSSLSVTNNSTLSGTLGVTGATTLSNASVNGTLGVTGNTSLSTLSSSGVATLNSLSVTNNATVTLNATVGGTLIVSGNTTHSTLSSSGLATLNSLSVTNNSTLSGTLGVAGNTTLSTLSSGLHTITTSGSGVARGLSIYSTTTSGTYPAVSLFANNSTTHGFNMYYGDTTTLCLNPVLSGDLTYIVSQDASNTIWLGSSGSPYNAYLKNLVVSILGTFNALTVTNTATLSGNTTVGGTLGVTGATTLSTLSTSGLAILNSLQVTNAATLGFNLTVGGTLGVTGATTLSTLGTTGAATLNSLQVSNGTVCAGTFNPGSTANGTWTACPALNYYMLSFTATGSYTAGNLVGSYFAYPTGKSQANLRRIDLYFYDGSNFLEANYASSSGFSFGVAANNGGIGVICGSTTASATRTFYIWIAST